MSLLWLYIWSWRRWSIYQERQQPGLLPPGPLRAVVQAAEAAVAHIFTATEAKVQRNRFISRPADDPACCSDNKFRKAGESGAKLSGDRVGFRRTRMKRRRKSLTKTQVNISRCLINMKSFIMEACWQLIQGFWGIHIYYRYHQSCETTKLKIDLQFRHRYHGGDTEEALTHRRTEVVFRLRERQKHQSADLYTPERSEWRQTTMSWAWIYLMLEFAEIEWIKTCHRWLMVGSRETSLLEADTDRCFRVHHRTRCHSLAVVDYCWKQLSNRTVITGWRPGCLF